MERKEAAPLKEEMAEEIERLWEEFIERWKSNLGFRMDMDGDDACERVWDPCYFN